MLVINNAGMIMQAYFNNFQCQAIKNASLITDFNIFYILNKLNVTMIVHDFELKLVAMEFLILAILKYTCSIEMFFYLQMDNTASAPASITSSKKISTLKSHKSAKAEDLHPSTISGVHIHYKNGCVQVILTIYLTTFHKKYFNFFGRTGPTYKTESSIHIDAMKKIKLQDIQAQISELSNNLKNLKLTEDVSAVVL
ncbi:hypothetical protein CIHG_10479 [Coccidioides immitis H538.4]|uniref:Uncharacterized protein n=1 Tax=Coccidioides immitis H538.4 TaxID=396776 RepID=A0A0J8S8F3_COCIT|nr:hypothetical protein CIHG_10479 [Coccidioides immitis H538.4]